MGSLYRGNLLVLLLLTLGLVKGILAGAYVEVQLLRYSDSCREDLSTSACDPMFTLCLDRPRTTNGISPCYYKYEGESGYFQNTNVIDLSSMSSIKGIPNPWIVYIPWLRDSSMRFAVRVRDDDTLGSNDDLVFLAITLTESVYPSQSSAFWAYREMVDGSYKLTFRVRVYCQANFFSGDCSIYCLAADNPTGHYTCNPATGSKICMRGWTGPDCSVDLNECAQNYCQRGRCENYPGDYACYCPAGYTGKNCTIRVYPCEVNPCSNNAICINGDGMNYTCLCVGDWEGNLCNIKLDPCKARPCQNGMNCTASDDHSTYTCDCIYPTTGINCEALIPETTIEYTTATTAEYTTTATTAKSTTAAAEVTVEGNYTQHHPESQTDEPGFQFWYAILIPVLVVIAVLIIVLVVYWRCRKQKKNARDTQEWNPDKQVFENNMYNDNREGFNKQQPLPSSQPPKSEKGSLTSVCIDEQGSVQPNKITRGNMARRLQGTGQGMTNPYTSFPGPNSTMETQPSDPDVGKEASENVYDTINNDDTSSSLADEEVPPYDNPPTIQPAANRSSISTIYESPPDKPKPAVPPKPVQNHSGKTPSEGPEIVSLDPESSEVKLTVQSHC